MDHHDYKETPADKRRRLEERYDLAIIAAKRAERNARTASMRNPPNAKATAHWLNIELSQRMKARDLRARIDAT